MTHAVEVLDRSEYLELALSAQRLVTGLVKARVQPDSVSDLAAIAAEGLALLRTGAGSYHALRTLRQARTAAPVPAGTEDVLEALRSRPSPQAIMEDGEAIDGIIRWFALFQRQALGN